MPEPAMVMFAFMTVVHWLGLRREMVQVAIEPDTVQSMVCV
ncbi:MAG TPA: hypothetical protein VGG39_28925 [Polyangiaceae bacterium]